MPLPEFRSEEAMRDFLPPQLLAALTLAKVMRQRSHMFGCVLVKVGPRREEGWCARL